MSQKEIEVIFVNAETNQAFARSFIPADELPTSFEARTTFHIKDEDWEVVKASSMTAKQFIKAGKLILTLQKVKTGYVQAKDILYTLPTLNKETPPLIKGSSKLNKHVLELHEDEWRQIELVSPIYKDKIIGHFQEIARIHNEQSIFNGVFYAYKEIYLRDGIDNPLKQAIRLSELYSKLSTKSTQYEGLTYEDVAGLIAGGFAFHSGELDFYGQQIDGRVNILCLHSRIINYTPQEALFLKEIMSQYDLILVDWRRVTSVSAEGNNIQEYLQEVTSQNEQIRKRLSKSI
jgi:hypothetical protein